MALRKLVEDPVGGGPEGIAYDRTAAPEEAVPQQAAPVMPGQDQGLAALGMGGQDAQTTDALSNTDLQGMVQEDPADQMAAELEALMNDPNTSPEDKAIIQQQLELAARQAMLGEA